MSEPGPRVAAWFTLVTDLLQRPLTALPHDAVITQLHRTFDVNAASLHWADPDGAFGLVIEPVDVLDPVREQMLHEWTTGDLKDCHALYTWYARTGDTRPMTMARVPTAIVSSARRRILTEPLRRIGVDQQLSVNVRLGPQGQREYVLARTGSDFTDEDLLVAAYVQRGVRAVDRQVELLSRVARSTPTPDPGADPGLSGRERAVLQLLADGRSTRAIGRHLGCSPRTVEKHLERSYRKLGVRDRLNAVREARLRRLITLEG